MDTITYLLHSAAKFAKRKLPRTIDKRTFLLGCVGIREDGAIVHSRNGSNYDRNPAIHSEFRLMKKLGKNGIVFVARILADGTFGLAKPCENCERALRMGQVKKVYYTIGPGEYGVMSLE